MLAHLVRGRPLRKFDLQIFPATNLARDVANAEAPAVDRFEVQSNFLGILNGLNALFGRLNFKWQVSAEELVGFGFALFCQFLAYF